MSETGQAAQLEETGESAGAQRVPDEQELLRLWREVLGVEDAGRDDDFFELGGDSITATRLVARLRRELGVVIPLLTLFEHPTPAELLTELNAADA